MPWWVWLILGMVLAKGMYRRRVRYWRMRQMHSWPGGWGMMVAGGRHGCGWQAHTRDRWAQTRRAEEAAPPVELTPAQKQERAMSELRRRYVADEITVEEYERELDRLIREQ